jgi:dimethylglycine dehydrogenase
MTGGVNFASTPTGGSGCNRPGRCFKLSGSTPRALWGVNVPALYHARLRRDLLEAGADLGLREIGFATMPSLRLEKSIGIWNAEYAQGYSPAMTGLDRWVADKPGFIGREAMRNEAPPARKLVMLRVDADGADATGFEPVWQAGKKVGFTTSGGYGHRMQQSYALAQVRADLAEPGTALTVHVVGRERVAEVIALSPYDPTGARMRL